jgi:hypothetical protein
MVDFNKINKWNSEIDKIKTKLKDEKDFKTAEKLRFKIKINEFKIKIERLN